MEGGWRGREGGRVGVVDKGRIGGQEGELVGRWERGLVDTREGYVKERWLVDRNVENG